MHELSIAENILNIVKESAKTANAISVSRVKLDVGRLSGIELGALKFAIRSVLKGSIAEKARIEYNVIEGQALCLDCGKTSLMKDLFGTCQSCGGSRFDIIAGTEMKIAAIEIETPD